MLITVLRPLPEMGNKAAIYRRPRPYTPCTTDLSSLGTRRRQDGTQPITTQQVR